MNEFNVKSKIYFGRDALQYINNLKGKKAFIVIDPFMVKSGTINSITNLLKNTNIDFCVFSDIQSDPAIEIINMGIKEILKFKPDIIIALGGGSSIDAAKSISAFGTALRRVYEKHTEKPLFIAIPTTSGTGSEVTGYSVITDKKKKIKYPIYGEDLIPDVAILDPELIKTVPKAITADTGMDVLTHAIEAYVATNATDYSDALAEKAIKLVFKYLLRAYNDGSDMEAREKMHNASCIAGIAFNSASLGLNHGMAHALGGEFHISHGRANAYLLPYIIEYNSDLENSNYNYASKKYREIANFLQLTSSTVERGVVNLVEYIRGLMVNLNIPTSLKKAGIDKEIYYKAIPSISKIAMEDKCTITNPRSAKFEDVVCIFKKVYGE
ncbi:1-propanol dehydrogenase PduQ [Clostridium lundense]|uniref:1-propanol dehydrogenase PduQ n=1 Tax=Clostridium lundense TaxID=319475 RepID=UPI0004850EB0|nr:1-propanol dehydrogenase PduQ [Clostridium lundense]